ncbi:MAG: response regulator [Nitrospiraceae bacterium]
MTDHDSLRSRPLILVVDDDPAFLEALPRMLHLRLPQVSIDTCASASDALTLVTSTDYHVIISDVKMPGLGGIGLLREASKVRPLTPFILITGHGDDTLAAEALGLGAYLFIRKPLDRDAFSLSIQRGLEAYDLRNRVERQENG